MTRSKRSLALAVLVIAPLAFVVLGATPGGTVRDGITSLKGSAQFIANGGVKLTVDITGYEDSTSWNLHADSGTMDPYPTPWNLVDSHPQRPERMTGTREDYVPGDVFTVKVLFRDNGTPREMLATLPGSSSSTPGVYLFDLE